MIEMKEQPLPDEIPLTGAATFLGCDYQWLRNQLIRGALPGRQIAGRWWVMPRDAVLRLLRERTAKAAR
jgi:hypothetical protein